MRTKAGASSRPVHFGISVYDLSCIFITEKAGANLDPISAVFAAYLESVSSTVHSNMTDRLGTEIQAVVVEYEGMDVPFQHQLWKVRELSVCEGYWGEVAVYSECTVIAKRLFRDLCQELGDALRTDWRYHKVKNMYCNAAISYKPTIARIGGAAETSPLQMAKQSCNAATVKALGSREPALIFERNAACDAYRELRQSDR